MSFNKVSQGSFNGSTQAQCGLLDFLGTTIISDCRINGWIQTPNIRGTWDILWTCLTTIFICTYTLLCLNVPSPHDTAIALALRNVKWMGLAIFAPEIVLTYAAGQWSRARQSVQQFQKLGNKHWSMRMAFFADMGGFVLQASADSTMAPPPPLFPLNAKQLHWLVSNGHIDYPTVTPQEIWDKSKQDRLTKAISAFQIAYLALQCIGRAARRLPITTLELSTLAIVVCSLMTAFAWLHKPANVRTPIKLYTRSSIQQITEGKPWRQTPLDFVDANMPGWAMNVQPFMKMPVIPPERPLKCIPNDRFPTNPYGAQEYFLCLATLVFTAIHITGWNFSFPSTAEKLLWRVCSVALFAVTALFWLLETMASWYRLGRWRRLSLWLLGSRKFRQSDTRASVDQDKQQKQDQQQPKEKPHDFDSFLLPWEFWSILPVALLYGAARLYLIVGAFVELRSLEANVFVSADWSVYLPHI